MFTISYLELTSFQTSNFPQAESLGGDDYNETNDGDGVDGEPVDVSCMIP